MITPSSAWQSKQLVQDATNKSCKWNGGIVSKIVGKVSFDAHDISHLVMYLSTQGAYARTGASTSFITDHKISIKKGRDRRLVIEQQLFKDQVAQHSSQGHWTSNQRFASTRITRRELRYWQLLIFRWDLWYVGKRFGYDIKSTQSRSSTAASTPTTWQASGW